MDRGATGMNGNLAPNPAMVAYKSEVVHVTTQLLHMAVMTALDATRNTERAMWKCVLVSKENVFCSILGS